jgi:hypothetical protein
MTTFEGFGYGETMQAAAAAYACWECDLCPPPDDPWGLESPTTRTA